LPFQPSDAPASPPSTDATPWGAQPKAPASAGSVALSSTQQAALAQKPAVPFPLSTMEPKRSFDEIPGAPWSRVAAPVVAPREEKEAETLDLDPLDLEVVEPEIAPPAPPPFVALAPPPLAPPPLAPPPPALERSTEITLERCAELRAEMDAGRLRDEVLGRAGVTGEAWTAAQRGWLEKMGAELELGRFELTNRYTHAFLDRQRALAAR